jgi:hypothetical protein
MTLKRNHLRIHRSRHLAPYNPTTLAPTPGARRPLFFWVVVAGCVVFALGVVMAVSVSIRYYGPQKTAGWVARAEDTGWFVSSIEHGGPAVGRLEVGEISEVVSSSR